MTRNRSPGENPATSHLKSETLLNELDGSQNDVTALPSPEPLPSLELKTRRPPWEQERGPLAATPGLSQANRTHGDTSGQGQRVSSGVQNSFLLGTALLDNAGPQGTWGVAG